MAFQDEIAAKLVADGVGVLGTSIFIGSAAFIPANGAGPYLSIVETGGSAGTRVQNQTAVATQRPTAQIACRASTYQAARAKIKAAYDSLDGTFNETVGSTFYLKITARQEPTDVGLDEAGRVMLVFNVDAEKYAS